jgi:HD-GYP domain-containing protein (c-di-GMP phosphodiesterase class II)
MTDLLELPLKADEIPVSHGLEETEGYGALPLRNLNVDWEIPFDVYVKIKKQGEMQPQFVKGCARGEVFRSDWLQKLLELKIPCVYISLEEMDRVMQYLHHNLDLVLADPNKTDLEKSLRVYDATNMWTINFFNSEIARTGEHVKLAQKYLDNFFVLIESDRHIILHLMDIRQHSFRLSAHCLNVCLLGLAFTCFLDWDRDNIRAFGLAALLHDIGLTRTPRAILEKRGKLTEEEMVKVKRHPQDGFRMMQEFVNMRWEGLEMVLQHHENGDGSGYPQGLKLKAIQPWSRILRILDSYEAMTAERPWRPAMEPKEALWIMRTEWDKSKFFDQNYLTAFVRFLAEG